MPRYFIRISFKGTQYHGWQIQPNAVTVQSLLNRALSLILQENIKTTGAGRTDTGVHAPFFMAHFETAFEIKNKEELIFRINSFLPPDIKIHEIYEAESTWHARYSAVKRTYHYLISQKKPVFTYDYSSYLYGKINLENMNNAAAYLLDQSDFSSFARLHGGQGGSNTNICKIYESHWIKTDDYLIYKISANRFLRNMVRAVVGTMIETGTGKSKLEDFLRIIELKSRNKAGPSAEAKGLFLTSVEYPPEYKINHKGYEFPDFLMI